MKIVIEKHIRYIKGVERVCYCVRYKPRWWLRWQYVMHHYAHSDPDIKEMTGLEEAKGVAAALRVMYNAPKDRIEELDEDGNPILKYSGG